MPLLLVGLGSAIGGVARYVLAGLVMQAVPQGFPFGTLSVNVLGSFLIGTLAGLAYDPDHFAATPAARQFFFIGLMGGFTTFSSFSLETLELAMHGYWTRAILYPALSVLLCLSAVALGFQLARQ